MSEQVQLSQDDLKVIIRLLEQKRKGCAWVLVNKTDPKAVQTAKITHDECCRVLEKLGYEVTKAGTL